MKPYLFIAIILIGTPLASYADSRDAATAAIPATVEIETRVVATEDTASRDGNDLRKEVAALRRAEIRELRVQLFGKEPENSEQTDAEPTAVPGTDALLLIHGNSGEVIGGLSGTTEPKERTELLSGTIVSADGLIVTHGLLNNLKEQPTVRLFDNRRLPASVVLRDERSGLVLLKVDADDLPHLKITSTLPVVGQSVASVVTAHGYRHTFLNGVISARKRTVKSTPPLPPVLQTDLAAGPGSNGGPLVSMQGELVGILASVPARGSQGGSISFAIPSNHVRDIVKRAVAGNPSNLKRGYLGIELSSTNERPVIKKVYNNSPAKNAGLQKDDGIVVVNGHPVRTTSDVLSQIAAVAAGEKVELELERGESEVTVKVQLVERPQSPPAERPVPRVSTTQPSALFFSDVMNLNGEPVAITPNGLTFDAPSPPSSITVERSNVEEKIDQLSKDIHGLREQIARLAAAMGEEADNKAVEQ